MVSESGVVIVLPTLSLKRTNHVLIPSPIGKVNHAATFQTHVVQLVGVVVFPYASCTPPTPVPSVAQVTLKFTASFAVAGAPKLILNDQPTGATVSKTIVSESSLVMLPKLSRNCIYTVLVPSHGVNVCAILALQVVQFVAHDVFPYATSTPPTPASVAQVVFSVTVVPLVPAALLLIVNAHQTGAALSCVLSVLALQLVVFNKVSLALTK
jgi:hypothetical protein